MAIPVSWFALKVNARSELLASNALANRGFEVFSPTFPERRLYADRFKVVDVPVLSGYVLIHWNGTHKAAILSTPAVQYFVTFGKYPATIPQQDVANIRRMITNGGQPCPYLTTGDRVRVESGILAGVEGIYLHRARGGQLVVSIELIERSVALHIDEDQVRLLTNSVPQDSSLQLGQPQCALRLKKCNIAINSLS